MNEFKSYEHCPLLSDEWGVWLCSKVPVYCPYRLNGGCSLSPMIDGFRKILLAEIEKLYPEEEEGGNANG